MKGTVKLSKEQKAGALALVKQYEKNYAHSYFEYLPVEGHATFVENGIAATIPRQLEVIKGLGDMDLGVEVTFLKNDVDTGTGCLTDALHNVTCLSSEPTEEEQEAYQAKLSYGTVRVCVEEGAIERLKRLCKEYYCELEFIDETSYCIKCFEGRDLYKVYYFPSLHEGSRAQIIVNYALNEEKVLLSKTKLNVRLKTLGAATIGPNESVGASVFAHDPASLAVLSYFFDIEPKFIMYLGPIRESLTQEDIDVFEQYCKK